MVSESFQIEQIEMARRRHLVRKSPAMRQLAVADFCTSIVTVAIEMRKIIRLAEAFGPTPETTEMLAMMEGVIRREYRLQFGEEMAGEQEFKNGN